MTTPDALTLSKVASIIAQGFKPTGLVLTSPDGKEVCIVDQSAVRWLDPAEMQVVMNPPCVTEAQQLTYVAKEKPPELKNEKLAGEFTMDELRAELEKRGLMTGGRVDYYLNERFTAANYSLIKDGKIMAQWKAPFRLGSSQVDVKFYDLEFFPAETAKEGGK